MMKEQSSLSYLYGTNVPYIEDLAKTLLPMPKVQPYWIKSAAAGALIKPHSLEAT